MKILWGDKDGGPESKVTYWGIESKRFGSIVLLCFAKGSRNRFHSHAFNSISWVLTGGLRERCLKNYDNGVLMLVDKDTHYFPSLAHFRTFRTTYHKVEGIEARNFVLSLRGPWIENWYEFNPDIDEELVLTHGRNIVSINARRRG